MLASCFTQIIIYLLWQILKLMPISWEVALLVQTCIVFPSCFVGTAVFWTSFWTESLKKWDKGTFTQSSLGAPSGGHTSIHPENGSQLPWCTRKSGDLLEAPAGPSLPGSAQTQPVFSVGSLFFLDPSFDKPFHIVHEANVFDFHSKERRNPCIQHITQCLENRFVPLLLTLKSIVHKQTVKHLTAIKGHFLRGKTQVFFYQNALQNDCQKAHDGNWTFNSMAPVSSRLEIGLTQSFSFLFSHFIFFLFIFLRPWAKSFI